MIADPALGKVEADLDEPGFRDGVAGGRWRVAAFSFPTLDVEIQGVGNDGAPRWWGFRFVLDNYPSQAPHARIWDVALGSPLAQSERPNGSPRLTTTFQCWASDTVYRPWERFTGPHNGNATNYPTLAWHPNRRLAFALEDLHGLLTSPSRPHGARSAS